MRLLTGFWNSHYAARQGWRPAPRSTPRVSLRVAHSPADGSGRWSRPCTGMRESRPSMAAALPSAVQTGPRRDGWAALRVRWGAAPPASARGGDGRGRRAWALAPSRFRAISASRPFPPGRRWPPFRGQLPGKGASRKGGAQFLLSLPSFPPSHCLTLWFGYTRLEDQGVSRRLCGGVFRSQKL